MAYIDDVYLVVNIAPVGIPTYVRLSQNENGRRLYFAVTGGEIPSGSTATMSGTKPDGVVYSKAGTISGNTVTFNEDIQLTAVAGEWPAKIVIVNGGQTVMTARIRFVIDADTVAAGAVPSDSQLEGLVAQAAAYAEAAKDGAFYGSPLVASTVAEMTDKTRVYVYTGSESGYTSGNWYYWSGSAWTSGGVYNATAVSTDTTLSVAGKAADAKATGDAIAAVTIPTDKTLTVSDAPADAKVVGDELADLKDDINGNTVRYDIVQEKTEEEKATARQNIGIAEATVYSENVIAEYEIVTDPPKPYSEITDTLTPASTVSGQAWNAETGAGETASGYLYSRFNGISAYSKIYVDGRGKDGATYPLCTFYDASGNFISRVFRSVAWGILNTEVNVPASASYAIVNGCSDTNRPIAPAVRGLINGESLGALISLDGVVSEGAWKNTGTVTSGSDYKHARYVTLPNSDRIYVSGVSWGATYPVAVFYDATGTLLRSDYGYASSEFNKVELSIPSGTAYFIVNMTHMEVGITQGVFYQSAESGRVPTKTQAEVNNELMPLIKKKYLFVGDSYAEGYSHDGTNPGWCSYAAQYMGLSTEEYTSVYSGGQGFANGGFANLIDTATGDGYTDVVICGGYNDNTSTEQTIISGITTCKNKALTKWPGASVHVGFIAYNKAGDGEGAIPEWQAKREALVNVVLPTYQKCVTLGCLYLNNVEYALGESGLTDSDGYHPSAVGNQSIAKAIANALKTGAASLPYNSILRAN